MKVMLLAAGKGERMLPLTQHTPKPLLKVGGKSLIVRHVERLAANGLTELVINHSWLGEQIEAALGDGAGFGVNIAWSREREPLESAGGIIQALPLLGDDSFICVNTDIWTDYSFTSLPRLNGREQVAWMVMVDNPPQHPEGDFVLRGGHLYEPAGPDRTTLTYSGIAVYHPRLFAGVAPGKQSVIPLIKQAMKSDLVGGEHYRGQWFDIGAPERLENLNRLLGT